MSASVPTRAKTPKERRLGWLPHPWLSGMLAVSWLLLQHTLELVHLLSAVLIGIVVPRLIDEFLPAAPRVRARPALRLAAVVLWDIVISNITVAKLVLGPMSQPQPEWLEVPLELKHPTAIALLASIITTTPGTVSAMVDEGRQLILVHALDCRDAAQMVADIKQRYEHALRVIFSEIDETANTAGDLK